MQTATGQIPIPASINFPSQHLQQQQSLPHSLPPQSPHPTTSSHINHDGSQAASSSGISSLKNLGPQGYPRFYGCPPGNSHLLYPPYPSWPTMNHLHHPPPLPHQYSSSSSSHSNSSYTSSTSGNQPRYSETSISHGVSSKPASANSSSSSYESYDSNEKSSQQQNRFTHNFSSSHSQMRGNQPLQ